VTGAGVIDSGICNLGSIARALERAGGTVQVVTTPDQVAAQQRLILPGVGSFPAGMDALESRGLDRAIVAFAATGKPVFGICLGMQLLFETGEEFGTRKGLGLIPGRVRAINAGDLAVPHMGWNNILPIQEDPLLQGLPDNAYFYFVHSFVCEPADAAHVLARATYGEEFCAMARNGNVRGLQAHPEKSQQCGATVLRNFLGLGT
jgi:glutamine amidotransferase